MVLTGFDPLNQADFSFAFVYLLSMHFSLSVWAHQKPLDSHGKMPTSRKCACNLCNRYSILHTVKKDTHVEYLRQKLSDKKRRFQHLLANVGSSRINSSPCVGRHSEFVTPAVRRSPSTTAKLARLYKTLPSDFDHPLLRPLARARTDEKARGRQHR